MSKFLKKSKIRAEKMERIALTITAAMSVALSAGVIGAMIYLLLALAPLLATRSSSAERVRTAFQVRRGAIVLEGRVNVRRSGLNSDGAATRL